MRPPFPIGGPVTGPDMCGREPERAFLLNRALRGGVVVVAGDPESGVTSLGRETVEALERESAGAVWIDLWEAVAPEDVRERLAWPPPADDEAGGMTPESAVIVEGAELLAELAETVRRELLDQAMGDDSRALLLFGRGRRPMADLFPEAVSISPGPAPEAPPPDDTLLLRLGPILFAAWLPYVLERFLETDRWIGNHHVEEICRITEGRPRHTQRLLRSVWRLTGEGGRVEDSMIPMALRTVLRRSGHAYRALCATLTANQRRLLRGLALEGPGAAPFSSSFGRRHGLVSPSSAQRALNALEGRELVRRDADRLRFVDPLLKRWLRDGG